MTTVHRNGIPPKKKSHKAILTIPDFEFSEDRFIDWCRTNCSGHIQYDFVFFSNSNSVRNRTYDLTIWFLNKQDYELFIQQWS
jgi:hypothetical protein